jgi:hypothetical protein
VGGNLWWFSKDGKQRYEISDDIIVSFVERDNKIYAIQGIAHLNISRGSIIEIKKVNGKWTRDDYLVLPHSPEGMDVYGGNFIIITSNALIKVDGEKNIEYLIKDGFWGYLYPTSLVIKEHEVYMGMRKGVYRYNLLSRQQSWLMRD